MDKLAKPNVTLKLMDADDYSEWFQNLAVWYAKDNVRAQYWSEVGATERAKNEIKNLLPEGLDTTNHHLFTIFNSTDKEKVGFLWVKVVDDPADPRGFIFDLEIIENHRRKGYATAAMSELEDQARSWGLERLSLHVVRHNEGAIRLYQKIGYSISGFNMTKLL